jgi:hypothetical protein
MTTTPADWPRFTRSNNEMPPHGEILGISEINYVQPVCPPIQVWAWDDAPTEYRALSTHGGDEDWVAFVPADWGDECPPWMSEGTRFAVCDLYRYKVENGWIYIGAHA